MKNKILAALFLSLIVIQNVSATQEDLDNDISYYVQTFSTGEFTSHRQAMNRLEWSGISSPKVYDILADKVLAARDAKNKYIIEEASWYVKALAFSGNEKYRSLFIDVMNNAQSSKLKKYTKKSFGRFEAYTEWNQVIANGLNSAPSGRLEEKRISNLLGANNLELVRLGAKRVYYAHSGDSILIDETAKRLESELGLPYKEGVRLDMIAWLIKAIGNSKNSNYRELLKRISATNNNGKIKKYAKKALKTIG